MAKKMAKKAVKKVTKKPVAKKPVIAKKQPLVVKDAFNKSQVVKYLAETTCLTKANINAVMDTLGEIIEGHLKKRGPGEFTLLGLAKFRIINKPATKARKGVNPFTGEPTTFAAKPARNIVKIKALKRLKDSIV
jgi:nucleoid DNA-binding protein